MTAAAGLLAPIPMQNLVTLAAMNHPHHIPTAPTQPISAQLTNPAPTLCKYFNCSFILLLFFNVPWNFHFL